jgi:hypothetical protein
MRSTAITFRASDDWEYLRVTRELLADGGVIASNTFAISELYQMNQ